MVGLPAIARPERFAVRDDYECDREGIEASLNSARRVCRVIRLCLVALTVLFSLFWVILTASVLVQQWRSASTSPLLILCSLSYGAFGSLMLWELSQLFGEVDAELFPFSEAQVFHLRRVALYALLLVLIELVFSAGFSLGVVPEFGYSIIYNNGNTEPTINLNIGMLVFSAIMYSLSVIFRYAALLQQLSDDTV